MVLREAFQAELLKRGIIIEHESAIDTKNTFVKLYAPFDVLARQAQKIKLRAKLNVCALSVLCISELEFV